MADATRRVSVRLSVDGAQKAKQDLREVGESGQRSLERIKDGPTAPHGRSICSMVQCVACRSPASLPVSPPWPGPATS